MKRKIITTEDGSSSFFIPEMDEHYHSIHGAIQESNFVYIDAGLKQKGEKGTLCSIFELGFGTGLNALLSCVEAERLECVMEYHTIEAFPLCREEFRALNYGAMVFGGKYKEVFDSMHECEWETLHSLTPNFSFIKHRGDFRNFALPENMFDVIYYDAFGPDKQSELWSDALFRKCYLASRAGGVLVTYSAKGAVRRSMLSVGYHVEKLPGPPGKRQMLRATK